MKVVYLVKQYSALKVLLIDTHRYWFTLANKGHLGTSKSIATRAWPRAVCRSNIGRGFWQVGKKGRNSIMGNQGPSIFHFILLLSYFFLLLFSLFFFWSFGGFWPANTPLACAHGLAALFKWKLFRPNYSNIGNFVYQLLY